MVELCVGYFPLQTLPTDEFCVYGITDPVDGRLLQITIRYGERMRAWIDVGYSVDEEH